MLGRKIDVVLGADVLRSAALFVFPGEHTLVFEPPGAQPAGFHRVPLSLHGRAAVVPVEADDHAFSAVLNLGSSRMAVSPGAFTTLAPKRVTDGATAGASRRITIVPVARLGRLAIGGEAEADVPYETSSLPSLFTADADAVIGSEELAPFDFGIDLVDGALWLRRRSAPPPPNIERAGLETELQGDAGIVVHIAKGSPAERGGWRPGQRICRIDGRPVAVASTLWKHGPEGAQVKIDVCDGSSKTLVLERFY